MLRRIALAITLITGSVQAEDAVPWDTPECEDADIDDDLVVHEDGSIGDWALMRLVLPDLAEDVGSPEWIETPIRPGSTDRLSLGTLGGRAVAGPSGEAIGVVCGCLVNPATGRVLALDVDLGPSLRGESRRVAVPWANLTVEGGRIRCAGDDGWFQAAPSCVEGA